MFTEHTADGSVVPWGAAGMKEAKHEWLSVHVGATCADRAAGPAENWWGGRGGSDQKPAFRNSLLTFGRTKHLIKTVWHSYLHTNLSSNVSSVSSSTSVLCLCTATDAPWTSLTHTRRSSGPAELHQPEPEPPAAPTAPVSIMLTSRSSGNNSTKHVRSFREIENLSFLQQPVGLSHQRSAFFSFSLETLELRKKMKKSYVWKTTCAGGLCFSSRCFWIFDRFCFLRNEKKQKNQQDKVNKVKIQVK